ncbi:MAG: hypothetical protein JNL74_17520 [Fibrobacteres bacterium]|nr:hypothetical protein [Fibrobacterota bacterium]
MNERFEILRSKYRRFYEDPANAEPLFIVNTPVKCATWEERLASPEKMLEGELLAMKAHNDMGDDHLPTVRVQFGTAQVASAFGSEIFYPENSLPAAKTHPLHKIEDVYSIKMPALDAGLFSKVTEFTKYYRKHIPAGVSIQLPDLQSPFNTAHLIRGDELFMDFYDNPDAVVKLLDIVTDYMIELVPHLKKEIGEEGDWFHDWGGLWKGSARISNCSMQMISPDFYCEHVLPRDVRLMKAIGGGRMHYCGRTGEVIKSFFKNSEIHALDFDGRFHDIWELSKIAPPNVALFTNIEKGSDGYERLMKGDLPEKRNLLFVVKADTVEEGREILNHLRKQVHAVN